MLIDKEMQEISAEKIAYEGLAALDEKYQKSVGFFAWDYFVATGKIIYDLWQKVIYIARCLTDLSNMEYEDLVNFVFQTRGIIAKTATVSGGYLTLTNGAGIIKEGDIFETVSGVQFQAIETKEVNTNDTFYVQCLSEGKIGNVEANTINIIPTTIQGIIAVTNENAFTNGYEQETKEALLKRYYDDIQKPITSGNIYHYEKWALEVNGVGGAKVKPLWNGDNTVKVVIIDANKNIPSNDLINAVQQYIDPESKGLGIGQAPMGAYCTVTGAEAKNIDISITGLKLKSGIDNETAQRNIENSIKNYFSEIAFDENITYVSFAKIGALIMNSDGVLDIGTYSVNSSIDNILLIDTNEKTEIPILQILNIDFEV